MRLKELAAARIRYCYRRLYVLLRREGWSTNHKRIYRLYYEEGLSIRTKTPRRRRSCRYRVGRPAVGGANDTWAMDMAARHARNQKKRPETVADRGKTVGKCNPSDYNK